MKVKKKLKKQKDRRMFYLCQRIQNVSQRAGERTWHIPRKYRKDTGETEDSRGSRTSRCYNY